MSVAIAGLWELGHNVPRSEAELWDHPLRDYAVDEWHMSPVTGIYGYPLTEHATVEDMLADLRARFELVFITEEGTIELAELDHPTDACYLFGKANWSPFNDLAEPGEDTVRIATAQNMGGLWPHQCMVSVLWQRRSQWP